MNLFGSPKYEKILTKKGYPPGMHGRSKFAKKSEFGGQLEAKQRARFLYNVSEKQFEHYYHIAAKMEGVTGEQLLMLLERRLDNVIFRAGFAVTRFQARQIASHGLVKLNGRRVNIPSVSVKEGDRIEVRERSMDSKLFANNLETNKKYAPPKWLVVDQKKLAITIKRLPEKEELEQAIDSQLVVEYYSK